MMEKNPKELKAMNIVALSVQQAPTRGSWELLTDPVPDPWAPSSRVLFKARRLISLGVTGQPTYISLTTNRDVHVY